VKPGVWGAVIGAVTVMILGFTWGDWTLRSTAEQLAQARAQETLVATLTPMCVERFMTQPEAKLKLAEFQQTASWRQTEVVEKGGWATAPGSTTPQATVAKACAAQLMHIKA
jgi:hypothetical protein